MECQLFEDRRNVPLSEAVGSRQPGRTRPQIRRLRRIRCHREAHSRAGRRASRRPDPGWLPPLRWGQCGGVVAGDTMSTIGASGKASDGSSGGVWFISYAGAEWPGRRRSSRSGITETPIPAILSPLIVTDLFGLDDHAAREALLRAVIGPSRPVPAGRRPGRRGCCPGSAAQVPACRGVCRGCGISGPTAHPGNPVPGGAPARGRGSMPRLFKR